MPDPQGRQLSVDILAREPETLSRHGAGSGAYHALALAYRRAVAYEDENGIEIIYGIDFEAWCKITASRQRIEEHLRGESP